MFILGQQVNDERSRLQRSDYTRDPTWRTTTGGGSQKGYIGTILVPMNIFLTSHMVQKCVGNDGGPNDFTA